MIVVHFQKINHHLLFVCGLNSKKSVYILLYILNCVGWLTISVKQSVKHQEKNIDVARVDFVSVTLHENIKLGYNNDVGNLTCNFCPIPDSKALASFVVWENSSSFRWGLTVFKYLSRVSLSFGTGNLGRFWTFAAGFVDA